MEMAEYHFPGSCHVVGKSKKKNTKLVTHGVLLNHVQKVVIINIYIYIYIHFES